MVEFKSWKDAYLFLQRYGNFTCLNCRHSSHNLDVNVNHSDSEYVHLFCTEWVAMVRLDFQFCCSKWEHKENGKELKDFGEDCYLWSIPENVMDVLENGEKWSIEEIEEEIAKQES